MTNYILIYGADKDKTFPHFLRGSLTPVRTNKYESVTRETLLPFWNERTKLYNFTEELFFISQEREVKLDFYPVANGFLASSRLLDILLKFSQNSILITNVEMLDEKGGYNCATSMKFCQITVSQSACDLEAMDIGGKFYEELDSYNVVQLRDGQAIIKCAYSVQLKENLPDLMIGIDIPPFTILVSNRIREECIRANLRGPYFVSVEDVMVVDFFPSGSGFSKAAPQWRERSDLKRWRTKVDRATLYDPSSVDAQKMLADLLRQSRKQ